MKKIEVKDNPLGLDVYINGVPDISLIPKDLMDAYINALKKGWLYMGVWERGKDTDRLHFHGLFYIPEMIGTIYEKKDYNTNKKKIVKSNVNTYFESKFGRNDFQEIDANPIQKEYSVK